MQIGSVYTVLLPCTVRAGPGLGSQAIETLRPGDRVRVLQLTTADSGARRHMPPFGLARRSCPARQLGCKTTGQQLRPHGHTSAQGR